MVTLLLSEYFIDQIKNGLINHFTEFAIGKADLFSVKSTSGDITLMLSYILFLSAAIISRGLDNNTDLRRNHDTWALLNNANFSNRIQSW